VPAARGDGGPEGRPLSPDVRRTLHDVLGPGAGRAADALRVHDGAAADTLARAHRADAVTVGRDVHFRRGRYRPSDDAGFALLVHEATHVLALLEPGAAWHRATGGGRRDEEARAQAAERAGRAAPRSPLPAVPRAARAAAPPVPNPVPTSPTPHPMTAVQDRDVTPAAAAAPDLEALRRGLVDELMRRLRTEFERGA
jgi:hypothetical protein